MNDNNIPVFLENNCNKSPKTLSTVAFVIELIGILCAIVIFCVNSTLAEEAENQELYLFTTLVKMTVVIVISSAISALLYGFSKLIVDNRQRNNILSEMLEKMPYNINHEATVVSQDHTWRCEKCNCLITKYPCEHCGFIPEDVVISDNK